MNELIENKKKSEILAETIASMSYGDVITHKEIENIIEEKYGSSKYRSELSRAKRILLKEHNKCIESIRGDGYRIISPDDFTTESLRHYRRGFNSLQRGADVLENAPVKDMTADGVAAYRRVYDRSVLLLASMKGAQTELKVLARPESLISPRATNRQ